MTKAEENALLNKIEKLIKSAGEDSYIAITFEGMIDLARANIENDFADSYTTLQETRESEKENFKSEIAKQIEKNRKLSDEVERLNKVYKNAQEETRNIVKDQDEIISKKNRKIDELKSKVEELEAEREARKAAEQEIIELKAKLYDLMTASK